MRGMVSVAVWSVSLAGLVVAGGCAKDGGSAHASHKDPAVCKVEEPVTATNPEKTPAAAAKPAAPAKAMEPAKVAAKAQPVATYGPGMKLPESETIPLTKLLEDPAAYQNKPVRVTGKISSVCPKKGCWVRVTPDGAPGKDGLHDVFVKFADPAEGRLVPMEAVGKDVTVEGVVRVGQISEAAARHFKEDAGASKEEIEQTVGPQKQIGMVKPTVAIQGIEPSGN